ncbi:linear amide C-N hydrolase [Furfurilactobacillus milii]|uniref:Linear amide C-N hydrolase n=1 Tax=Furfurilactobacillus milii TaxID=2888272 RepID=A0A6N9HZI3_9LACO|nr:linear amide C-N hydrolase [Furfurilactobacillus milii]MYV16151.1 linear amide C-N hydrolase [Furfurilactobacillus milii]
MCTAITLQSVNEHAFFARTMDLPTTTPWRPIYLPAGFLWQPSTDNSGKPLPMAILGGGRWTPGNHYLMGDGMNEAGLACAELYFPVEARYASSMVDGKLNITPQDFIYWALTHHSIAELRLDLPNINIVAQKWYSENNWRPFHWLLTDVAGNTAILEPRGHGLTLTEAPLHVLTNTPNYPAHIVRLAKTLGIDPESSVDTFKQACRSFNGELRHTNLPTDRFQRSVINLWRQNVPQTSLAAEQQLLTLLDDVVIPRTPERLRRSNMDYTHYEDVLDLTERTMTFKSVRTGEIHHLRLDDIKTDSPQQVVAYPFT